MISKCFPARTWFSAASKTWVPVANRTEALLISIGAPRLQSLGIEVSAPIASPEHKLYLFLADQKGDAAHSSYNALIRQLVSFERAAACAS